MTEPPPPEYVQPRRRLDGPVTLAPPDDAWPTLYAVEEQRIRAALQDQVLLLEHVGSTSVRGLAAKPVLDILLAVADPAAESDYVTPLEGAGYLLHLREPEWHEHRLLRHESPAVNLHVFAPHSPEIRRMLAFRDRLRSNDDERELYQATKHELAARSWAHVQDYADAKSVVVEAIIARALA
jgi:GrpB-like predicted nucleotidyltransferase (UPF0157 family)